MAIQGEKVSEVQRDRSLHTWSGLASSFTSRLMISGLYWSTNALHSALIVDGNTEQTLSKASVMAACKTTSK